MIEHFRALGKHGGLCMVLGWATIACTIPRASAHTALPSASTQCEALAEDDFSGVQDAPTQVTSTRLIEEKGKVPTYCRVQGYIAPEVGFELRLPAKNWNGKFMEVGCGGWCGFIAAEACDAPLGRGYACIASDMGHKGTADDVLWAEHNLQAQIDFGYRATHVAALAGKAVVRRYYQQAPRLSYFVGCSTGGYQGLTEAQRFPWDFDGIIAGAPDIDESAANLRATWVARVTLDQNGRPLLPRNVLKIVHSAALSKCDKNDGLQDGVIGDPFHCAFDPRELICKGNERQGCLTAGQAEAVNELYVGAAASTGEPIYQQGFARGSELLWGMLWPVSALEQYFRYGISGYTASSKWRYTELDFDRDYKRFGLAAYYDNSNPDLRKFKRARGKLIVYHGGNDTINLPGPVIDYYKTVEKTMGGRSPTQQFFRLFIVPGMNHCTGGDGAYAIDYLHYLEAWVERSKAPDKLIGAHVRDAYLLARPTENQEWAQTREGKLWMAAFDLQIPLNPAVPVAFTRPIYPYPLIAEYAGRGNPDDASSFNPVEP